MIGILGPLLVFGILSPVDSGVSFANILPSDTDPQIGHQYNSAHSLYVNRGIVVNHRPGLPPDRHELLVWLPGTAAHGPGPQAFCELAANLGYHVVSLSYPNNTGTAVCRQDADPDSYLEFRMAILEGGKSAHKTVAKADCIRNRLGKLLLTLQRLRPEENWGQFMHGDGINWPAIALAGHSQGGGHAALLGIKHRVARVICFGGPKDYNVVRHLPAAWYGLVSATPKACFFAFNNRQDPVGCSASNQFVNLAALKLDAFGLPADVDAEAYPYHHARILTTGKPPVAVLAEFSPDSVAAHLSMIDGRNALRFRQVWTYVLTEKVP